MRLTIFLALACGMLGCGANVSNDELGTLHAKIPPVPGAEEPYELTELEAEAADEPLLER